METSRSARFRMASSIAGIAIATSLSVGFGATAWAEGNSGNESCPAGSTELTRFESGAFQGGAEAGDTTTQSGVTITIATVNDSSEATTFDWTSDTPISYVLVKAGSGDGATRTYSYSPAESSDQGLTTSDGNDKGISHATFCVTESSGGGADAGGSTGGGAAGGAGGSTGGGSGETSGSNGGSQVAGAGTQVLGTGIASPAEGPKQTQVLGVQIAATGPEHTMALLSVAVMLLLTGRRMLTTASLRSSGEATLKQISLGLTWD